MSRTQPCTVCGDPCRRWSNDAAALWLIAQCHYLHHMMTVLLAFKVLSLLFEAIMYHFIRARGHTEGWNIVYYIFALLKGA